MIARSCIGIAVIAVCAALAGSVGSAVAAERLAQIFNYSASGTHTCEQGAGGRTCVVTGLSFGSCVDAASALKLQDCCRSGQVCTRDVKTGERRCEDGAKSVAFHMNYCIGGPR